MKLGMAKAYVRLERDFIANMRLPIRFPNKLVNTIMKCVSTITYHILINGVTNDSFIPRRGI